MNKNLKSATEYIETVYGTVNFAKDLGTQDGLAIFRLMDQYADHVKNNTIDPDAAEDLGRAIDRVNNFTHALLIPVPAEMHVEQLKIGLPEVVTELKTAFAAVTGENPWED